MRLSPWEEHSIRTWAPIALATALLPVVAPWQPAAAQPRHDLLEYISQVPAEKEIPHEYTEEEVDAITPLWPNPHLSFLPAHARPDRKYWRARARFEGIARREGMETAGVIAPALMESETEPNDTLGTASFIAGFGTGDGDARQAQVDAAIGATNAHRVSVIEDEGSIPLATETGLTSGRAIQASATIGDGSFGATSGDFDFFRIPSVAAGESILVDVDTPVPHGPLDSLVVVYDSTGTVVAFSDDDGSSFDSFLQFPAPAAGDYYVSIGGYGSFSLRDPFDSSSGSRAGSVGSYDVRIGLGADVDFFRFELTAGDVIGASVSGAGGQLALYAPDGELRIGSGQDLTFIHPSASPLPGGGNAALSYVAEAAGTWALAVRGTSQGAYQLDLVADRPALLSADYGGVQTIFLDFDGAVVDAGDFGVPIGTRALSPLSSFLGSWGLSLADEDAVIDAIVSTVVENASIDMRVKGSNGDFDASEMQGEFDVEILNSRDHPDPYGNPHVSRVVIGGTIFELGLATIGIAESIDVGNFETSEDSVVLLDLLSARAGNPNSLNTIPRAPGATIIDVIAAGVGNIASHELGHYSGNWHTEPFATIPNVMDQGGNLPNMVGVGPDGIFGTADDDDVDFGRDRFVANEGFTGVEETLDAIAFGFPTPLTARPVDIDVEPRREENVVNLRSNGRVAIALLGSPTFDVRDIDPTTVAFGPGAAPAIDDGKIRDVDGDGLSDLELSARVHGVALSQGDDELCATGELFDGRAFLGCDFIVTHPRSCDFVQPGPFFQAIGPVNGGFETGDLTDWTLVHAGSGGVFVDDGSIVPPGPGGPVLPFEGTYASVSLQSGPGSHTWTTDVSIPAGAEAARVVWADHLSSFAPFVDDVQEWRVEVWNPADDGVLAELHSTQPGDPAFQDWTVREADLTPWVGQAIRLAFTQVDNFYFFNARLDAVEVQLRSQDEIEIDIQPQDVDNPVNPASQGLVSVALLGSATFDVHSVDATTLGFGPNGARPGHDICESELLLSHVEDVDLDGQDDLIVHFRNRETGIAFGDTEACVKGALVGGTEIVGCDTIQTVGACGIGFELALVLPLIRTLRRRWGAT
jgi:hypothetical protein